MNSEPGKFDSFVLTGLKFSCALCGHSREGGQTAGLSLDMDLPRVDGSEEFSITQCLATFLRGTFLKDCRCDGCGKSGHVTKATRIKHTAKYAVIKLTRTDIQGKVQTNVPLPTGEVSLGSYFASPDTESAHQYEVMGGPTFRQLVSSTIRSPAGALSIID